MGKHFWEQSVPCETEIEERIYTCPDCGELVLRITSGAVPTGKIVVKCPNGHLVKVPKFE